MCLLNALRSTDFLNVCLIAWAVLAGFTNAVYMAGAGLKANGDFGTATYPWDLAAISNATPANQKTSLVEVRPLSSIH